MNRFKEFFLKYSCNRKTVMIFTYYAFYLTLFLLFLFFIMAHDKSSPEFKYYDFYLTFSLIFITEFIFLNHRNYDLKSSFIYSFVSNYLIFSFFLLLNELTLYFCINLEDAKISMSDGAYYAISLRTYIVQSTWLEYLLYFLIISGLTKFTIFKIIHSPKLKNYILDFLIINLTFLIFYFSLSKNYFIIYESINSYYNLKMYSSDYYIMMHKYYSEGSEQIQDPNDPNRLIFDYEIKKSLYTKPNNLLTKVLDCFVKDQITTTP